MCCTGFIKRAIPFFITLIVGLFIASFFVDLRPKPFAFPDGRRGRCRDFQNLYMQERDRADRLQEQLDRLQQNPIKLNVDAGHDWTVPPPPIKKAPRAVR